jgi:hypothetical protein
MLWYVVLLLLYHTIPYLSYLPQESFGKVVIMNKHRPKSSSASSTGPGRRRTQEHEQQSESSSSNNHINSSNRRLKRLRPKRPANQSEEAEAMDSSTATDTLVDNNNNNKNALWWPSKEHPYVPLKSEQAMIPFLIKYGPKERGMFKSQPAWRVEKLQRECRKHHMTVAQALSLRRHHLKLLNPNLGLQALRLGNETDIRESAEIFERLIESVLRRKKISFWTEDEQHAEFKRTAPEGALIEATPDFLLREPTTLKCFVKNNNNNNKSKKYSYNDRILEERVIHWIEVKMFYGASTIPHESKGAVGSVLKKIQKYVQLFGSGAIIFMQGCGDRLAQELNEEGVSVLDCCHPASVDLTSVLNHQKTWCSDNSGRILP